ncbi:metallophosphoesterase family protein [Fodinibius sediminis]|uniref:3',5'-cyclic AMP phosphodiesterase CpdA n=1 Tax=Fodinibius sediminis TaxID=1214077 RepID=A0A521BTT5_9BACT|nr:metallophosphoesterase [Fodinibius sediminis]SMO50566.1 3',5'-cyclic AMP phosphodiesterase CpdA [Fodinibius sediminis]
MRKKEGYVDSDCSYAFSKVNQGWLLLLMFSIMLSCKGTSALESRQAGNKEKKKSGTLRIGILPDTQGHGASVSIYPMEAVLDKLQALGADIVIPVGDLTNKGTAFEFQQWTAIAEKYRDAGMAFLPLMGNHETSFAYTVEWVNYMKDYIPQDAVHMGGAQYQNYYIVRENVLIVILRYYNLPVAFQWVKEVVNEHKEEVDHIVIASHDGLIGAKYGETREMIVEGTKGDNLLLNQWDEIRSFFSKHDVIWVQGHEHMYQRSVISAPIYRDPVSWSTSDRNYRLPQYTQIIAGNASYKGYEFRYGEREKVQAIIQQKMNTRKNGSEAFDVNAALLSFNEKQVDFEAYYASHTVADNEEGKKELENPDWILMDRFERTKDRCERIVYPNSIPTATRPVLSHDMFYRTNECIAPDESAVKILAGINNTFNRVESTSQILSLEEGFSRAENQMDLMRLAYQYLFQAHEPWTPNLNSDKRLVLSDNRQQVNVPATTIDLKEHLTLSWMSGTDETLSDILVVSGTQIQTGVYSSAYGMEKDLEKDGGIKRSQPDGSAKEPHPLPESATKSWEISSAESDTYVLEFTKELESKYDVTIGYYEGGHWKPFSPQECVINNRYESKMVTQLLQKRSESCREEPVVGYDSNSSSWWVMLHSDIKVALIPR